ncbi:hypothetical protein [Variovorax sp.]|jgi:hypothetical protein|uniref:hypothetical protein n=1 Tax=Variovorax sp. TaxID=1871043 RepID=UPI0037DA0523
MQFETVSDSGELAARELLLNDLVKVQPGRYQYHASDDWASVCVRLVIDDYLAAEVVWTYW